jgi:predicted enzyme related to lactoylglutathione lyase
MTDGAQSIVFPVRDAEQAKAVFRALLNTEPHTDQPYYIGFNVGGFEIGLDPNGHSKGLTGPVTYWKVDDVKSRLRALVDAGATIQMEPTEVGGGTTIAVAKDADGNPVGLIQQTG